MLGVVACSSEEEAVADRLYECRDLVRDRSTREASLDCFTEESRGILRRLLEEKKRTGGLLDYGDMYRKLLDFHEIVGRPRVEEGGVALVELTRRRQRDLVVLYRGEDGVWRIDARELRAFWHPLDAAGGAE